MPEKFTLLGLQGKQFPPKEVPAHPRLLIRVDLGTSGVPVHTCHCWWLSIISFLFFQASAALYERLGLSQPPNTKHPDKSSVVLALCYLLQHNEAKGRLQLNSQGEKSAFPRRSDRTMTQSTIPAHSSPRLQPPLAPRTLPCINKCFSRAF